MPTPVLHHVVVALVSAVGLIGATSPQASTPSVPAAAVAPAAAVPLAANGNDTTRFEKQVLSLVNKARASKRKCGSKSYAKAKPLKWNTKLALAAERHSSDMANRNYFSHTNKKGQSPGTRIKATGYRYKAAGETLAAGYSTPEQVVKAWLKSAQHCKILMNKSYTQLGVGFHSGNGKYMFYTTANFAKPK
ncbi:MAG: CAP domain-containing protein [Propionicimonas sp.]